MVGIEQQLFQATRISQNLLRHGRQRAMTFVDKLHLPITAFEDWNALEHGGGGKKAHTHTHTPTPHTGTTLRTHTHTH